MLNLAKCIVKQSSVLPVLDSVLSLPEGVPLTRTIENGTIGAVSPCTGVADEYFAGFSENRFQAPSQAPMVEDFTIPGAAPYTRKLAKVPVGTEYTAYIAGVKATVVASGPTTGEIAVAADGTVTFAAADAGKDFQIVYRYNLTMTEAALLFGWDAVPFLRIPQLQTTVFEVGTIYTDQYLMSDDWAAVKYAYLGPNGKLTTATTGTRAGVIVGLPAANNGYLGVEISI